MTDDHDDRRRQRAALGMAMGRRAEEVHHRAEAMVFPNGLDKNLSQAYLDYRLARTLVGTLLIARWLVTGIGANQEEMDWVTNSGAMAAREGVPLVLTTRAFHYWREILIEVAREEAVRLGTPADVLEEAVLVVRRSSDASLVWIADANDSQLRAMNAQLEKMNAQTEKASQFKSEFLAKMSHELRTPLTGIIGFCEVLLDGMDGELNHEQAQDLGQIHRSGLVLLDLVNQILDLSKIEAGKMVIDIEEVDLGQLADQVIGMLSPLAEAKSLALKSEVLPAARRAMGDAGRVRQVLTNLVSNAIKFTLQGSVEIYIKDIDGMAEVSVLDAGVGIAPEALNRIFEEFRQADDKISRVYGGTGLGLSISNKLVELQGGHMGVESTPGKGSRFWFTLPLAIPR